MKINIIITTTDSKIVVNNITKKLLENNYSPCIQVIPKILSTYKWKNKIVKSDEILILIKTNHNNLNKCKEIILYYHNYEIPEIISGDYDILNKEYKEWFLDNSTG